MILKMPNHDQDRFLRIDKPKGWPKMPSGNLQRKLMANLKKGGLINKLNREIKRLLRRSYKGEKIYGVGKDCAITPTELWNYIIHLFWLYP